MTGHQFKAIGTYGIVLGGIAVYEFLRIVEHRQVGVVRHAGMAELSVVGIFAVIGATRRLAGRLGSNHQTQGLGRRVG